MALIPILISEEKVQVDDKVRLDASKSFVTTGSSAMTTMTIKPEDSGSAISVFSSTVENRYLDWVYTTISWDIDSTNNKIYFNEGGSDLTATLTSGTYTRAQLLTEIQTRLDVAGDNTYTVSESQNKITISATGSFSLLPLKMDANLLPHLGYYDTTSSSTTHTSERFEYAIKKVTVVIGDGTTTATKSFYVKVHSVISDALYSSDSDIMPLDSEIMRYVPKGRASFIDVHRVAQNNILDWLDQNGFRDQNEKRYRKFDILDKEEVKNWSKYMVLRTIYFRLHNQVDDVYRKKSADFEKLEVASRSRFILSLDSDKDGEKDLLEKDNTWNGRVYLR